MRPELAIALDYDLRLEFCQLQENLKADLTERACLTLLLLVERAKGSHSIWAPYIASLPQTYRESCYSQHLSRYVTQLTGTARQLAVRRPMPRWRSLIVFSRKCHGCQNGNESSCLPSSTCLWMAEKSLRLFVLEDGSWWSAEELSKVMTTRLGRLAEHHRSGLRQLTAWCGTFLAMCR